MNLALLVYYRTISKRLKVFRMRKNIIWILLLGVLSCATHYETIDQNPAEPERAFSFDELLSQDQPVHCDVESYTAQDGVEISYYPFRSDDPRYSLVFLHGGGAHGFAGYQYFAERLSGEQGISVYLMDLRGHGLSAGPRGDSPSVEQPWQDISQFIDLVKKENPSVPLVLGGHSSGGGMALNFLTEMGNPHVESCIFISPELGYKSKTAREDIETPFAEVDVDLFIKNAMSGGRQAGNDMAVFFNYPQEVLAGDPLLVSSITVNMSNSMTPQNPKGQFADLNVPFALYVGALDELFYPEEVIRYASRAKDEVRQESSWGIVEGVNHLSILLLTDQLIMEFLNQ